MIIEFHKMPLLLSIYQVLDYPDKEGYGKNSNYLHYE